MSPRDDDDDTPYADRDERDRADADREEEDLFESAERE